MNFVDFSFHEVINLNYSLIGKTHFFYTHKSKHVNLLRYRGADKSLARPGRKQARKHGRDGRDFNNIETRAVINLFFLQGKAPKEIHAILTRKFSLFPSWSG